MNKYTISLYTFIAFAMLIFHSCENEIAKIQAITKKSEMPLLTSYDVNVLYSDSGLIKTQLNSPEVNDYAEETDKPSYTEFPNGLNIMFYDTNMVVKASLTAKWGQYQKQKKMWEFKNNVVLVNIENDTLTTEHLFVDTENEKMTSDVYVCIKKKDGSKMQGKKGFESNLTFTKYQFKGVSYDGWNY